MNMNLKKVAILPVKGAYNLIKAPFVLPWVAAKSIYGMLKIDRSQPYRSFDVLYELKGSDEDVIATNYKVSCRKAYISLFSSMIAMGLGIIAYNSNLPGLTKASAIISPQLILLSVYFQGAVSAYCLKTRSFDNKLGFLKSLEDILPDPYFYERNKVVVKRNGKNIPVNFYPKGNEIMKKK